MTAARMREMACSDRRTKAVHRGESRQARKMTALESPRPEANSLSTYGHASGLTSFPPDRPPQSR